jgi:heme exporter protein D
MSDRATGGTSDLKLKLHSDHCKLAWDAIRSSSDDYDKHVLQLSSAFLALSVTFMKDVVKGLPVHHYFSLYTSWVAFGMSIIAVILSFQFSIAAHKKHLNCIDDYYLRNKQEALTRTNRWDILLTVSNATGGGMFLVGVMSTIYFVISNVRS